VSNVQEVRQPELGDVEVPVRHALEDVRYQRRGLERGVHALDRHRAVQAWGELLRHEGLRQRAVEGFERVRQRMAEGLRRGQAAGTVPADLDPDLGLIAAPGS